MLQALNYISSSAENLYKFLFINGTIFVILSMFYPLQEKNEIKIKTIEFNKNVEIINYEISVQTKTIDKFKVKSKQTLFFLDSISKNRSKNTSEAILERKMQFNSELDSINASQIQIDFNVIKLNAEKEKIIELEKQARTYSYYSIFFLIIGIIFFVIGVIGWSKATIVLDKIKQQELKKIEKENKE